MSMQQRLGAPNKAGGALKVGAVRSQLPKEGELGQ